VLAKRAAVGFEELTPRPNVKKIFKDNNLSYEKYCQKYLENKHISTETIVEVLVGKVKDVEKFDEKMMKIEREIKEKK
jgi:hypothetical protein